MALMTCGSLNKAGLATATIAFAAALFAAPASAATGAGYDERIRTLTQAIQQRDDAKAARLIAALREQYKGNSEVEAIGLRFECSRGNFKRFDELQRQAKPSGKSTELFDAIKVCHAAEGISQARRRLENGDAADAASAAQSLYLHGSDPYAAGLLLAEAYARNQQPEEARKIYAELARRYPKDPGLAAQARALEVSQQLTEAKRQLDDGDAIAAIRVAGPLYASGPDPYDAGLLLAQAYVRNQQPEMAKKLYAELANRYPNDRELAAQARALEDDRKLTEGQQQLDEGNAVAAIRIAEPLYMSGSDPYRAGLLLAQAYARDQQPEAEQKIYAELAARYPNDPELAGRAHALQVDAQLSDAQRYLDGGNAVAAIRIAEPLYSSGPDPYRAGLLLAQAYMRTQQPERAQKIYADLAARYPNDHDLTTQSVVLLAQTHQTQAARQAFESLAPSDQRAVMTALDWGVRPLYPNSIAISGTRASSSHSMPGDDDANVQLALGLASGTIAGGIEHAHRFGESAIAYSLDYYRELGAGYSGEVGVSHSPSETFLARHSITLGLSKDFNNFTAGVGWRHLVFVNAVANVLTGEMDLRLLPRLQLRTGVLFVPETSAYSIKLSPVWTSENGSQTFAYLTGGMAGEQLGVASGVLRTPTYTVMVGHTIRLTPTLTLTADTFYEHRASLYNRWGIDASLVKRW